MDSNQLVYHMGPDLQSGVTPPSSPHTQNFNKAHLTVLIKSQMLCIAVSAFKLGVPTGDRTPATRLKVWRPIQLDDRDKIFVEVLPSTCVIHLTRTHFRLSTTFSKKFLYYQIKFCQFTLETRTGIEPVYRELQSRA